MFNMRRVRNVKKQIRGCIRNHFYFILWLLFSYSLFALSVEYADYNFGRRDDPCYQSPEYDAKPFDKWGYSPEVFGIPSLPLFPGSLCPGVVVPVWVASMSHIELFNLLLGISFNIT